MPSDFLSVTHYRMYLDYVDQMLSYYSTAPQPSGYIIHSPHEFSQWVEWAKKFDAKSLGNRIIPLGLSEYTRDMEEFKDKL